MATDLSSGDRCIAFAVHREAKRFVKQGRVRERYGDAPCPAFLLEWAGRSALILETGVGRKRVDAAWEWLTGRQLRLLISAGYCGGLVDRLRIGDVVCPATVTHSGGESRQTEPAINQAGRLLTVDRLVGTPTEKGRLADEHDADAVDMESFWWAKHCENHGIPFAAVRVVSDTVTDELSPRLLALLGGSRVRTTSLIRSAVTHPKLLIEMLRLARRTGRASANLRDALNRIG